MHKELILELESSNHKDDEVFTNLINKVLGVLDAKSIARKLTVSIPTINRWASGRSIPHLVMRPLVIKDIISLLG